MTQRCSGQSPDGHAFWSVPSAYNVSPCIFSLLDLVDRNAQPLNYAVRFWVLEPESVLWSIKKCVLIVCALFFSPLRGSQPPPSPIQTQASGKVGQMNEAAADCPTAGFGSVWKQHDLLLAHISSDVFFFFFYSEQMRAICSVMFGSICTIQSCCLQVGQWHGLARLVWRMRSWIPLGPITGSDSEIWEGLVAHFLFLELISCNLAKRGFTHNIWKNQKHHSDCTHWSGRRRKCYCERSLSVSLPEGSLIP